MAIEITADRLREVLDYDPETGVFRWRQSRGSVRAGSVAGCVNLDGYIIIRLDGKLHYAHRLAWLYVHGEPPAMNIDHANLSTSDNRISNLRIATKQQNAANASRQSRNKSGFKGVWPENRSGNKVTWNATIRVMGKNKHLGRFDDPELAHKAYLAAAKKYYGDFARGD